MPSFNSPQKRIRRLRIYSDNAAPGRGCGGQARFPRMFETLKKNVIAWACHPQRILAPEIAEPIKPPILAIVGFPPVPHCCRAQLRVDLHCRLCASRLPWRSAQPLASQRSGVCASRLLTAFTTHRACISCWRSHGSPTTVTRQPRKLYLLDYRPWMCKLAPHSLMPHLFLRPFFVPCHTRAPHRCPPSGQGLVAARCPRDEGYTASSWWPLFSIDRSCPPPKPVGPASSASCSRRPPFAPVGIDAIAPGVAEAALGCVRGTPRASRLRDSPASGDLGVFRCSTCSTPRLHFAPYPRFALRRRSVSFRWPYSRCRERSQRDICTQSALNPEEPPS